MKLFVAPKVCQAFADSIHYVAMSEPGDKRISEERHKQLMKIILPGLAFIAEQADLTESAGLVNRTQKLWRDEPPLGHEIYVQIGVIMDLVISEMNKKRFYYVPPAEAKFLSIEHPFGERVASAFPSAKLDIKEAANCMGLSRFNGAVYHLVCAAEVGLRALAWDRRVVTKTQKDKKYPLELAEWGTIIKGLEGKIASIRNWKRTSIKPAAEQFYNEALVEVRAFNNGWRTHAMHSRGRAYRPDDASALFGHVRRFMQTTSAKISETERTPVVWTKKQIFLAEQSS